MTSEERLVARDAYGELANEYARDVEMNEYNVGIEFPRYDPVVPDVDGKRVLDAGCGTGLYTEWLLNQGAEIVGVDRYGRELPVPSEPDQVEEIDPAFPRIRPV